MGMFSSIKSTYDPTQNAAPNKGSLRQSLFNPAQNNRYTQKFDALGNTLSPGYNKDKNAGGSNSSGNPVQNRKADLESGYTAPTYDAIPQLTAPTSNYQAGPTYQAQAYNNPNDAVQNNALNRRFDVLRAKTEGEANTQSQQANDSLQRAAAAHGQLGSGSLVKQQMVQQKGLEGQKMNAINDVESQRESGAAQLANDQANKQFAFNQEEAGRAFQSGEAEKQRGFAANQAGLQNQLAVESANRDNAFKDQQFSAQNAQFSQQMNMAIKQMNMDQQVTNFNENAANKATSAAQHKDIFQRGRSWWDKKGIKL